MSTIFVCHGYCGHHVSGRSQRRVVSIFIPPKVVFVANASGLYLDEFASLDNCTGLMEMQNPHVNRRIYNAHYMPKKLTAHFLGKVNQRRALLRCRLLVNKEHRLCWIRLAIRIAQRRIRFDGANNVQAGKRDSVPASVADVPRQNRFFSRGVDFAVGEALSGVDVSTAGFNVLSGNLWHCSLLRRSTHNTGNSESDQKKRIAHGDLLACKFYNEMRLDL